MKLKTLVIAFAAVLGIGGSAAAYQMAASPASPVKTAANHSSAAKANAVPAKVAVPKILPVTRFEWAPCAPPAHLKGDECVTQVVRTVSVPSSSGGGSTSSGGTHHAEHSGEDDDAPAATPTTGGGDDDEGEDHEDEDDHGDDHDEDD